MAESRSDFLHELMGENEHFLRRRISDEAQRVPGGGRPRDGTRGDYTCSVSQNLYVYAFVRPRVEGS